MDAESSVKTDILLDMREDSFEGIACVGNVELWIAQVCEQIWKIPLYAVVGTPQATMGVVPSSCDFISRAFLEKRVPLVVPEFQP